MIASRSAVRAAGFEKLFVRAEGQPKQGMTFSQIFHARETRPKKHAFSCLASRSPTTSATQKKSHSELAARSSE